MKLNTAFKLSALTLALITTHAMAATVPVTAPHVFEVDDVTNGHSKLTIDKLGTTVDAKQTAGVPVTTYEGTTLKYDTVVDKSSLEVIPGTNLYVLKNDGSKLEYKDSFKELANPTINSQYYDPSKLEYSFKKTTGEGETFAVEKTATVYYDENGFFKKIDDVVTGNTVDKVDIKGTVTEDTIIVGKEKTDSVNAFTVRNTADGKTKSTVITAGKIEIDGKDITEAFVTSDALDLKADKTDLASKADEEAVKAALDKKADKTALQALNDEVDKKVDQSQVEAVVNKQIGTKIDGLSDRVRDLNKRVDDVEKTAYRGVAIALAAQQNVPNIKSGQYAVFGGVGHYESESAFAMGVVGAINERTSISGAVGVAGGSEVGGRVGVAYVFGGK